MTNINYKIEPVSVWKIILSFVNLCLHRALLGHGIKREKQVKKIPCLLCVMRYVGELWITLYNGRPLLGVGGNSGGKDFQRFVAKFNLQIKYGLGLTWVKFGWR